MTIAIVAPSPVPFLIGGAEKLWMGMFHHFNSATEHQCELIKVPIREDNFYSVVEAYETFYRLELSHFDMVISTKYPAWMVRHPNHHLYMQHTLRGLYDTYHLTGLPEHCEGPASPAVEELTVLLDDPSATPDAIFAFLAECRKGNRLPEEATRFPGPLIRRIVHTLDAKAMEGIKSFSAISRTVASREGYFPDGARPQVIYHPSFLSGFADRGRRYFFTASRLDEAKRIGLIVEAYRRSGSSIPLKIAGTGPLYEKLRRETAGEERIELLGFVSDAVLVDLYADAYAVIFAPYDEDYGLITVEAMMSRKPVVATEDSGGVREFVEEGVTGLVAAAEPAALAETISRMAADPGAAAEMGKRAYERVRGITWQAMTKALLEEAASERTQTPSRCKVTLLSTFDVYPPRSGGQNRIYHLGKNLARSVDVELIVLTGERSGREAIAEGFTEVRIPKPDAFKAAEARLQEALGTSAADLAMMLHHDLLREYALAVLASLEDAACLILEHPYTYPLVRTLPIATPLIYDAHNVEYELKRQMLPDTALARGILEVLAASERQLIEEADRTLTCSEEDAETFRKLYRAEADYLLVPNGTDTDTVPYHSPAEKLAFKAEQGIERPVALFVGSCHKPNIEALETVIGLAEREPAWEFVVVGSVSACMPKRSLPANMTVTGIVPRGELLRWYKIADLALNPMRSGSGTNLKVLDYLAAGIPLLSTPLGIRGIHPRSDSVTLCESGAFVSNLHILEHESPTKANREHVEACFAWKTVAGPLERLLEKLCGEFREENP